MHQRKTIRLRGWDYSRGWYFVTINTYKRFEYFGKYDANKITLSIYGILAKKNWLEIPKHFSNAKLDKFIIMPDHIHGILILKCKGVASELCKGVALQRPYNKQNVNNIMSKISPKPNTLPTIVRSFKSKCTYEINKLDISFGWQREYHEHIIRNKRELNHTRKYIQNNASAHN